MKKNLIRLILPVTLLIGACTNEPTYSKKITACLNEGRDRFLSTGKIAFFENPVSDCLDEKLKNEFIGGFTFKDKNGSTINTDSITKPIYLQTFSRKIEQCKKELKHLNDLVDQYKDDVEFILIVKNDDFKDVSKLLLDKDPETYGPLEINQNISVVYFSEKDIVPLKAGYGELIFGVRNTEYPTTYYISKNKSLFKLTTIEDILISTNIIYTEDESLSDEMLSEMSFKQRVPEIMKAFIEANKSLN
ncbi:hypothetical protein [Chryseotalea sanaruensis]|nr:hypothetical protein [Chryseotalea sanaruensis]